MVRRPAGTTDTERLRMDVEKKLSEHESRLIAHDALIKAGGEQSSQILQKQAQLETLLTVLQGQAERHKAEYNDSLATLQKKIDKDIKHMSDFVVDSNREVRRELDMFNKSFGISETNADETRRKWERMLDRDDMLVKRVEEMRSFFWKAFLTILVTALGGGV